MLLLFATKVCSRCEPVPLHLSGFELALDRDAVMAPFCGRYGCMSLYLVSMVTLNFISLQPLLAFVHHPLGLKLTHLITYLPTCALTFLLSDLIAHLLILENPYLIYFLLFLFRYLLTCFNSCISRSVMPHSPIPHSPTSPADLTHLHLKLTH